MARSKFTRRRLLQGAGVTAAGLVFPHLWIPREVKATEAFGTAKHLVYIRLSGGFRFPVAFNGAVGEQFNPFGLASGIASGTEWGVGRMLDQNEWRTDELAGLGMKRVPEFASEMTVLPCVDHEPLSGSADGNHATGLERFLTGEVGGATGLFTMLGYGLRERTEADTAAGIVNLPPVIMGESGMGRGSGAYAAYRPAVLRGDDLDRFAAGSTEQLPDWARSMAQGYDTRNKERHNPAHSPTVDAYIRSREATRAYADIFASDILKVSEGSGEVFDGLSNGELATVFGDSGGGRAVHLALRLFHFGCPAVYIDQGGYDMHSDEERDLPGRMEELVQILSALEWSLKRLEHPSGGTYWDHTVVAAGSEFSRSARGARFNSARGSDHGGDFATRWMSMPFMGGPIGAKGRSLGSTDPDDLSPTGDVFSYRSTWKTMMDLLGAESSEFFPADDPYDALCP